MRRLRAAGVAALWAAMIQAAPAWPAEHDAAACPTRHTVVAGEHLARLGQAYFGKAEAGARIYAANRARIGRNPDLLEVGTVLTIPCPEGAEQAAAAGGAVADGAGAGDAVADGAAADGTQAASGAASDGDPAPQDDGSGRPGATAAGASAAPVARASAAVRGTTTRSFDPVAAEPPPPPAAMRPAAGGQDGPVLLTGGPYPPFVTPGAASRGMVPTLVAAAFAATDGAAAQIAMVNDRAAHLSEVLPRGGFALSFPWTYPACASDGLDTVDRAVCARFVASDALYEHVTEFYARADGAYAGAAGPDDLAGARICRPAGYPLEDLRRMGLLDGAVQIVRAPDPRGCLAALDGGDADIASMDATVARYAALDMELAHPLLVLEALTRVEGLRALALRGDPAGEAAIARLNEGLRAIAAGGTWFEIVRDHLAQMTQ